MSKVFSITLLVAATAYIRADTQEEAIAIARGLSNQGLEVEDAGGDITISGLGYDNEALPDVSFSPAMTIQPLGNDDIESVEVAYDPDEGAAPDEWTLEMDGCEDRYFNTYRGAFLAANSGAAAPFAIIPPLAERITDAKDARYTVNEKAPGAFVFNDPDGNDDDSLTSPYATEDKAWAAAWRDMQD